MFSAVRDDVLLMANTFSVCTPIVSLCRSTSPASVQPGAAVVVTPNRGEGLYNHPANFPVCE
jgi:hypothetical protein